MHDFEGSRGSAEPWQLSAKCGSLSTEEINRVFFVGTGGKSKKSRDFCSGAKDNNPCPVQDKCLLEAITFNLEGFWSGSNVGQRKQMREFRGMILKEMDMPPEPDGKRKGYRKIIEVPDPYSYLDTLEGPSDEELREIEGGVVVSGSTNTVVMNGTGAAVKVTSTNDKPATIGLIGKKSLTRVKVKRRTNIRFAS